MRLTLISSIAIVVLFSLLLIAFDEWVARSWRRRRWERRAKEGDERAQRLLRIAKEVQIKGEK